MVGKEKTHQDLFSAIYVFFVILNVGRQSKRSKKKCFSRNQILISLCIYTFDLKPKNALYIKENADFLNFIASKIVLNC